MSTSNGVLRPPVAPPFNPRPSLENKVKVEDPTITDRRHWVRVALAGKKFLLPWESQNEYEDFYLAILHQHRATPITEIYASQLASALWRLNRIRKLESVAFLLSPSSRFAFGAPIKGQQVAPEDLGEPAPAADGKTWGEVLREDLDTLSSRLEGLSRYEIRLWTQAQSMCKLLQPYIIPFYGRPLNPEARMW